MSIIQLKKLKHHKLDFLVRDIVRIQIEVCSLILAWAFNLHIILPLRLLL